MVLLGANPPGRNVEQHDYFFGIATSIVDLVPQLKAFWPEAGASLHIDGWREVTMVNGYAVEVKRKGDQGNDGGKKLFFINLGGYLPHTLAEQHHIILAVHDDKGQAVQSAKKEAFFKTNSITGARSHIDEKYALDVDNIYGIEDILSEQIKQDFFIDIYSCPHLPEDAIILGYYRLDKLLKAGK